MSITLTYTLRSDDTAAPSRVTSGSAGYDLTVDEAVTLPVNATRMATTGVAVAIPAGHVGLIVIRSSFGAKKGITLANQVGVIDSDYRGEMKLALRNNGDKPTTIERGTRVAQLIVTPIAPIDNITRAAELPETERGTGGFGSTDQKEK